MSDYGCLTVADVCKRLQVSRATVMKLIKRHDFDGVAFRMSGEWRFDHEPFERWIQYQKAAVITTGKVA